MHLLGHHLPDHKLLRVALTSFYGVSHHTSALILARLQIHQGTIVSSLTEPQVTALSAYLSSPSTTQRPAACPVAPPGGIGARGGEGSARAGPSTAAGAGKGKERALDMGDAPLMLLREQDRLDTLKIETDLRRSMQSDIAHQRSIGTYRGRRHAMGLPVRGQNTRNNAKTAKKMNRVDRKHYSTSMRAGQGARAGPASTWSDVARLAWSPIAQARRAFGWAAGGNV